LIKYKRLPIRQIYILYSEKLTILLTILIFCLSIIINSESIELFFILIYLGLLVIKELTDEITPHHVRLRLNLFIFGFFILIFLDTIFFVISLLVREPSPICLNKSIVVSIIPSHPTVC